jgi:BCD family chlorophyll transporter-like MFS transporter
MAVLALGGVLAALSVAVLEASTVWGVALAAVAFTAIGLGVGASGTSLLALLAKKVNEQRRAAAATIVWVMMIAGFVVTAGIAGQFLDPYSPARLIAVTAAISAIAFLLAVAAVSGVEKGVNQADGQSAGQARQNTGSGRAIPFRQALQEVWSDRTARHFTIFVFISMLAYSAQDLVMEPFAGTIYGMTPGETTSLAGIQNGGVLLGMLLVAVFGTAFGRNKAGSLRQWTIGGCIASSIVLVLLAGSAFAGPGWPLRLTVFALGVSNGAFAVAAIGSMMGLAGQGKTPREGMRMGLWGAAQAIAFGLGGLLGTAAVDVIKLVSGSPATAYAAVFACQAVLFSAAAIQAARIGSGADMPLRQQPTAVCRQTRLAFDNNVT